MPSEEKQKNNMPLLNLCHPKVPCKMQKNFTIYISMYKGDAVRNPTNSQSAKLGIT